MLTLAGIEDQLFLVVAVGGGILVAIVAITFGCITRIIETRSREQSRREIAAYVAEGTISPDEGERLIAAGENAKKC